LRYQVSKAEILRQAQDGLWGTRLGVWFGAVGVLLEQALVAAVNDLAHGSEVVYAENRHHLEFAIELLVHLAVFPDDQRGYGFRALDVGDVEAFDASGKLGEHEGVGESLLNGLAAWFEDTKALDVGLFSVLAGEVNQGSLFAALGDREVDAMAGAGSQEGRQGLAVGKVYGNEDGARDVMLIDV
jgi:hypothetical protein